MAELKKIGILTACLDMLNQQFKKQYNVHGTFIMIIQDLARNVNRSFSRVKQERMEDVTQALSESGADGLSVV